MRVVATNVLPGDRVRGVGLVVTEVVPENDFWTTIEGKLSTRTAEGETETSFTKVTVPNEHLVNVVRADENFHADRIAATQAALTAYAEDDGTSGWAERVFVDSLNRIANMPRGQYVGRPFTEQFALGLDGSESAAEVLDALDALAAVGVVSEIPFD